MEKEDYKADMRAKLQQEAQAKQVESGTPTQPDGSPKGGMDGNTVNNRSIGRKS